MRAVGWLGATLLVTWMAAGCGGVAEVGPGLGAGGALARTTAAGGITSATVGGITSAAGADAGAAASSGAAGTGQGGVPSIREPSPNVDGVWIMIGFEDPLMMMLSQHDGVLTGRGCDTPSDDLQCGDIVDGTLVGRRARVACSFSESTHGFSAETLVSADGTRMTGTFSFDNQAGTGSTWLRAVMSDQGYFLPIADNEILLRALRGRPVDYDLTLATGTMGGPAFASDRAYFLGLRERFIYGDLGAFHASEMFWSESDQTLSVGPVATTDPNLPSQLTLQFDDSGLITVLALLPAGSQYVFQAVPRQ